MMLDGTSSRTVRTFLKPFCTHTNCVEISPRRLEGTFGEFQIWNRVLGNYSFDMPTKRLQRARHGYHGCSLPRRRCCSAEQLERPVNIFLLYTTHISGPILIATLQAPQALSAGGVEGHAKRGLLRGSVQGIYPYRVSTLTCFSDIFTITLLCVAQCKPYWIKDQCSARIASHARSLPLLFQSQTHRHWQSYHYKDTGTTTTTTKIEWRTTIAVLRHLGAILSTTTILEVIRLALRQIVALQLLLQSRARLSFRKASWQTLSTTKPPQRRPIPLLR